MSDLFIILKWYLLASVVSGLYGIILSVNYITESLTNTQGQYLDLLANLLVASLYLVAFIKTIHALRAMPNNTNQPTN
jgi:type III secretory pathway component EscS